MPKGASQDNRFGIVPRNVTFSKVSITAKVVFEVLAQYANGENLAWPSRTTIAEHLSIHPATVTRALGELRDAGFVAVEPRYSANGSQTSNVYHLMGMVAGPAPAVPVEQEGAREDVPPLNTDVQPPTQERVPPLRTSAQQNDTNKNETIEREVTTDVVTSDHPNMHMLIPGGGPTFDDFWRVYPRRNGKGAARASWHRAVMKADVAVIIAGAVRFRDDPNRDPAFTAYPSTWLNQERWDDDPLPPRWGAEKPRPLSKVEQNIAEYHRIYGDTDEQQRSIPTLDTGLSEGWSDTLGTIGRSLG